MNFVDQKIVIVDYGMGNIRSVKRKFNELGYAAQAVSNADDILQADKIVLPGVGHFAHGVNNLKSLGLWDAIDHKVKHQHTPVLGICLGMQLMGKYSEEGDAVGFGWLDAQVVRFEIENTLKYKIPHIGWNNCEFMQENPFTKGLNTDHLYYFVHAYHMVCANSSEIIGTSRYEKEFISIAGREHIIGVQFHPEKSHDSANSLIHQFAEFSRV